MRTLTLEELDAIKNSATSLATCCLLEEPSGQRTYCTAHDADIVVDKAGLEGRYTPVKPVTGSDVQVTSNADVGNLEITVGLNEIDFTADDVRAGRFRQISYIVFLTDWRNPHNVGIVIQRGTVGNVNLIRPLVATFELRQLKQFLQQQIIPAVSRSCRVDLGSQPRFVGDAACTLDLTPLISPGTVDSVFSRKTFEALDVNYPVLPFSEAPSSASPSDFGPFYAGGVVRWLTGMNRGYQVEVRLDNGVGGFELFEATPFDIQVGDTFDISPGCDKTRQTCRDKYNNLLNFQGEPDAVDIQTLAAAAPG